MIFMVTMRFHADDPEVFRALVPQEQAHVRELTEQGTIHALYLAADGSSGWMVMRGNAEEDIESLLTNFPLRPHMTVEIMPLR